MSHLVTLLACCGLLALAVLAALFLEILLCRCEERNAKMGLIRVYKGYDVYNNYYECRKCSRHYIDWRTLAHAESNERGGLADKDNSQVGSIL